MSIKLVKAHTSRAEDIIKAGHRRLERSDGPFPFAATGLSQRDCHSLLDARHSRYPDATDRPTAIGDRGVIVQLHPSTDPVADVGGHETGQQPAHGLARLPWSALSANVEADRLLRVADQSGIHDLDDNGATDEVIGIELVCFGLQRVGDVGHGISSASHSASWVWWICRSEATDTTTTSDGLHGLGPRVPVPERWPDRRLLSVERLQPRRWASHVMVLP